MDELSGLSDLCFRSKAVWGSDEEFREACRGELSFEPRDLELTPIAIAEHDGKPIGVAQLRVVDGEADLLKLFVEPSALRSGTGKALLAWAIDVAKEPVSDRKISPQGKGSSATSFPAPSQRALGRHRKLPSCGKREPHRDPPRLLVAWHLVFSRRR